eukprot:3216307-Rhodomonas_salina.1
MLLRAVGGGEWRQKGAAEVLFQPSYATCSTDLAYSATSLRGTDKTYAAIFLIGTDFAYAAT